MSVVLDSSALLAWAWDEPGAGRIDDAIGGGLVSAVNWAEVLTRLVERGLSDQEARDALEEFPIRVVPFDAAQAVAAGLLRRATRAAGLSLGDRACLALAQAERLPALTADRAWGELDLDVAVEVVR